MTALQLRLDTVEGFAQQSLDTVALDGPTHLPRHGQAEPWTVFGLARKRVENEMPVGHRAAVTIYPLELRTAR